MNFNKIKIISFIMVSLTLANTSQDNIGGLFFKSNYDERVDGQNKTGTTLTIPSDKILSFNNDVTIEFDIFLWRKAPFGFILSAGNYEFPDIFILSYADYRDNDTSYIDLSYLDRPSILSIPIVDKNQGRNIWKNIKIHIDYNNARLGISYDGSVPIWYNSESRIASDLQFRFGKTSRISESPRMAIRNIRILNDEQKDYEWLLNEKNGSIANSSKGIGYNNNGSMTNGTWLSGMHSFWNMIQKKDIKGKIVIHVGYDQTSDSYIYIKEDSLIFQNIKLNSNQTIYPFNRLPSEYIYFFDHSRKKVGSMHAGGGGPVSYLDLDESIWKSYDPGFISKDFYYQSEIIIDQNSSELFTLGGYGWYESKNTLQKYDPVIKSWEQVSYSINKGNEFYPRSNSSISYDKEKGIYYVFGGDGNESGKQEQGFRSLNDLWEFDLGVLEMEKVWEDDQTLNPKNNNNRYLILPELSQIIHLSFDNFLYVSNLEHKNFINTKIKFEPSGANNYHVNSLEYLTKTNELFISTTVEKEKGVWFEFYTISLPLVPMQGKEVWSYSGIIILGIFFLGIFLFIKVYYHGETFQKNSRDDFNLSILDNPRIILKKGVTVHVFSGFNMWIDGKNINYEKWRSKKARDLFLYILLKNSQGVYLSDINSQFWPDVKIESARNSRSVALNKIRKLIKPYGTLIENIDDRLIIRGSKYFYSDYWEVLHTIQNNKKLTDQFYPLNIYGKSGLLPDNYEDWIDLIRIDIEYSIKQYAKELAKKFQKNKNWELLDQIGRKILSIDQFDDDGLQYAIIANKRMMKDGLAHKLYKDFCNNYKLQIGESYRKGYDMIKIG